MPPNAVKNAESARKSVLTRAENDRLAREARLDQVVTCRCARCGKAKRARLRVASAWYADHRSRCDG